MKRVFSVIISVIILLLFFGCPLTPGTGEGVISVTVQKNSDAFNSGYFIFTLTPESGTAGETREKAAALSGDFTQTITAFSGLEDGNWTLGVVAYESGDPENNIFTLEETGISISGYVIQELLLEINYLEPTDEFEGIFSWL